jgi:hypothetical protein
MLFSRAVPRSLTSNTSDEVVSKYLRGTLCLLRISLCISYSVVTQSFTKGGTKLHEDKS